MAVLIFVIDVPGATVADLVEQVVLDDGGESGSEDAIHPGYVRPDHVLQLLAPTLLHNDGYIGTYKAEVTFQGMYDGEGSRDG
jgi:hypothetical protein